MAKKFLILLSFIFLFVPFVFAEESITLTTYYPSPYGSYYNFSASNNVTLATVAGSRVGIGTLTPGEKLEVNGAIKFTVDASVISKAPRVIYTPDNRGGCPPAAAANTDLYVQSFTLTRSATIVVAVDTITTFAGRTDTLIYIDGAAMRSTLTDTTSASWKPVHIIWGGTLAAGAHTVSIRSSTANSVGCGTTWGGITTTIYE